jgi:PAS domain S-box-containing protein
LSVDKLHEINFEERTAKFYAPIEERKSFQETRLLPDGRIFQISSYLRPEGGWVVIHEDVTQREKAVKALAQSETLQREQNRQFQDALENLGQGITMYDHENRLVICNRRYHEIYGLSPDIVKPGIELRAIARLLSNDKLHDVNFDERTGKFYAPLAERESFTEVRHLSDGRVFQVSAYLRPEGGWVVLHRDITEIARAEAEAEELRHQERLAVASGQAKSAFLAMMSHEIRTPMNAVIGLSLSLLDTELNEEQRHTVEMLYKSSDTLLGLLNNILDLSKLDAGKFEFEALPFSTSAVIDHTVSMVSSKAKEKGLTLRTSVNPNIPAALVGDHTRLRQVLLNLANNAIKFTTAGVVEISANCLSNVDGQATVEISVRDTGIGIAPANISRLFSEFSQADASTSRNFGGTGLGLAICKRIVEQMGGEIRVESQIGVGSKFTFVLTLPVTDEASLVPAGRGDNEAFSGLLRGMKRRLQVLLAEDNHTNQIVFSKLLQGFDVDVTIACNGKEAVEFASSRLFDIVMMDMRMPEMNGLEATQAIRALGGKWSYIPIIALTANAFADDVKACREAGMNEFVSKPIRKKTLIEVLVKALAEFRQADANYVPPVAALPAAPKKAEASPADAVQADAAPVLDHSAFKTLIEEIDLDGVRMTLDVFLTETKERLALLKSLSCERDRQRIRDEAHTLKGSSGTFGLRQVTELAKAIEHGAPTLTSDHFHGLLARLEACFDAASSEAEAALSLAMAS